jgi:NAD(P)-dependent dehydrogenase (short-subunit alcohol dehydrogenase family)
MIGPKVFVVTGATSGIGEGIAKQVAATNNNKVVFCGRRVDKGQAVEKAIRDAGGDATFVQADCTKEEDIAKVFAVAEETYGGVDVFIANAGIEGRHATNIMDPDFFSAYDECMDINLVAVIKTVRAGIPYLQKRGGGTCFVMSSVNSSIDVPGFGPYCMSKAGCDALVRCLASETEDSIDVYSINPYLIDSELTRRLCSTFQVPDVEAWAAGNNPSGKMGTPADIGKLVLNTLDGKYKEKFPSGSSLLTDGHVLFHAREAMVLGEKGTPEFEAKMVAANPV